MKTPELKTPALIAGAVLATVVVLIVTGLAIKSLAFNLITQSKVLSKKNQAKHQLDLNINAVTQLTQEYNNLGTKRQAILNALPTSADFPGLSSLMENLSHNAGVNLVSLAPAEASAPGTPVASTSGATQYNFTATVSGGYDSIKSFLRDLEVSNRPMTVNSFSLSGNAGLLSAEVNISTYYQPAADINPQIIDLKSQPATSTTTIPSTVSGGATQ